jgi:hypothetical protein
MRLEEAVKLSDQVRALTNQLLDAITDLIEDEAPVEAVTEVATKLRRVGLATRLSTLGRFRARVIEGEPVAVAINDMVASHGWSVGGSGGRARIMAVEALERAYRLDSVALDAALWTVTSAWGWDRAGVDGRIIEGLTILLRRDGVTRSALAEHLRTQWTAMALLDVVKRRRDEAYDSMGAPPRSADILARIVGESFAGA